MFGYNRKLALLILVSIFGASVGSIAQTPHVPDGQVALSQPLTVQWKYMSDRTTNLTPTSDGERIYLPLSSGMLVSIRAADGVLIWKAELGGELSASPTADVEAVYTASQTTLAGQDGGIGNGVIRALGRESGITHWVRVLPKPIHGSLISNNTLLYGGSRDGRVYAIRKRDGQIAWTMQHSAPFASWPTLVGSRLYVGSEDGYLFCMDQTTGRIRWRYQTGGTVRGHVVEHAGIIYFGSGDGYVYAVDEVTGRLRWQRRTGAGVHTVSYSDSGLLVASLDNFVYYLSFARGERLWKRQLAGRLAADPLTGPDGALFTPLSSPIGVVLDLQNGKQLNSLPIGEDNDVAASPISVGRFVVVTTRQGLLAFARPG